MSRRAPEVRAGRMTPAQLHAAAGRSYAACGYSTEAHELARRVIEAEKILRDDQALGCCWLTKPCKVQKLPRGEWCASCTADAHLSKWGAE